jgi:hypothetical protein
MDALAIENEVIQVSEQAVSFKVEDNDDLKKATLVLKGVKGLIDKVKEIFDPIVDKANKAHKEATSQRNKHLEPLKSAEIKLKSAILSYSVRIEEERKKAEDIANKKLLEEAEEEKKKLLQKAEESENEWESEKIKEQAKEITASQVIVESKFEKQEGLSIKTVWKAKVLDPKLLISSILDGNGSISWIEFNQTDLNKFAVSTKGMIKIPGLEIYEEKQASIR